MYYTKEKVSTEICCLLRIVCQQYIGGRIQHFDPYNYFDVIVVTALKGVQCSAALIVYDNKIWRPLTHFIGFFEMHTQSGSHSVRMPIAYVSLNWNGYCHKIRSYANLLTIFCTHLSVMALWLRLRVYFKMGMFPCRCQIVCIIELLNYIMAIPVSVFQCCTKIRK